MEKQYKSPLIALGASCFAVVIFTFVTIGEMSLTASILGLSLFANALIKDQKWRWAATIACIILLIAACIWERF